jgi:aryl-alcohol dehydrogenase-like predicted oxidoreductase
MGLASEQSIYHLDNRTVELEVIPACEHYGVGLIPWSPLGGGLLGGVLGKIEGGRRWTNRSCSSSRRSGTSSSATKRFAGSWARNPATVALAWLLHNPVVSAPIIGPRTLEQLESAVRATEVTLDEATLGNSTRSFRVRAGKHRTPTPGKACRAEVSVT